MGKFRSADSILVGKHEGDAVADGRTTLRQILGEENARSRAGFITSRTGTDSERS
jgi:hypothetical protein